MSVSLPFDPATGDTLSPSYIHTLVDGGTVHSLERGAFGSGTLRLVQDSTEATPASQPASIAFGATHPGILAHTLDSSPVSWSYWGLCWEFYARTDSSWGAVNQNPGSPVIISNVRPTSEIPSPYFGEIVISPGTGSYFTPPMGMLILLETTLSGSSEEWKRVAVPCGPIDAYCDFSALQTAGELIRIVNWSDHDFQNFNGSAASFGAIGTAAGGLVGIAFEQAPSSTYEGNLWHWFWGTPIMKVLDGAE